MYLWLLNRRLSELYFAFMIVAKRLQI